MRRWFLGALFQCNLLHFGQCWNYGAEPLMWHSRHSASLFLFFLLQLSNSRLSITDTLSFWTIQFVRDSLAHKANDLRTCYSVWFDRKVYSSQNQKDIWEPRQKRRDVDGVAIATSVVPGKLSFPVGFGVVATCCSSRLEQVSSGGLKASWSANYIVRVWYCNLHLSILQQSEAINALSCFLLSVLAIPVSHST